MILSISDLIIPVEIFGRLTCILQQNKKRTKVKYNKHTITTVRPIVPSSVYGVDVTNKIFLFILVFYFPSLSPCLKLTQPPPTTVTVHVFIQHVTISKLYCFAFFKKKIKFLS